MAFDFANLRADLGLARTALAADDMAGAERLVLMAMTTLMGLSDGQKADCQMEWKSAVQLADTLHRAIRARRIELVTASLAPSGGLSISKVAHVLD
ncbi:MAG TPA: hypothetical protein VLM89_08120 [Phycisphaerae bacterium]|nr:hypothetical protein [Phycisphaerae bacterium]